MSDSDRQPPSPASAEREIEAEQAHLDRAFARLDAMRANARTVRDAYDDVGRGGTHQARLERDIAYDLTARRLAALQIGDTALCFGRLDLTDGEKHYIGRIGVDDEDHEPLVVDWRAPAAAPFYRATAVEPLGVSRRRHFLTRGGREIVGLDDEVFDQGSVEERGLGVTGEGALMAALGRERTGRMSDIVATIQSEQDEAIRAGIAGPLVLTGGPGSGKTAVALHRAAYLLYTHRDRLAGNGVLMIGPSGVFLRYIDQVLPSLGEHDVVLATISGLRSKLKATSEPDPRVASLKGDQRMAGVIANAVRDRQRPLREDLAVLLDGVRVVVTRRDSRRVVEAARRRRGPHNAQRRYVVRRVVDLIVGRWKRQAVRAYEARRLDRMDDSVVVAFTDPTAIGALARGEPPPEGFEDELRDRVRRLDPVVEALEWMWPVLSGPELVGDLLGFAALARSAASGALSESEIALLTREWNPRAVGATWTDADVALVDEADALLGPVEAARARRRPRGGPSDEAIANAGRVIDELDLGGMTDARALAERFEDPESSRMPVGIRTFGHILVDEAQDLTAMQWRMLARRCPSGSMTIVGDPGQASRPGAVGTVEGILSHVPARHPPRVATLSINYRTPSEVMEVAARLLAVAAPTVEPSTSVRSTGEPPEFIPVAPDDLVEVTARTVTRRSERGGRVAVIAPVASHEALLDAMADLEARAGSPEAIDAPVAILEASDAKGLEFDHVVVVEPAKLVSADRAGLRLLYVTITRATQTLAVVHAEPLPEGLVATP